MDLVVDACSLRVLSGDRSARTVDIAAQPTRTFHGAEAVKIEQFAAPSHDRLLLRGGSDRPGHATFQLCWRAKTGCHTFMNTARYVI